jgi:transposase-like protein
VQTCTVHLIRAAMRFVSYADRKKVAAALRARDEIRSFVYGVSRGRIV